ncbi:GNAT family N-acetyltransferase [Pararhizobium sp. BT-229]|uniref:GNAT family N-acetyltransferase n=1 Tax=Pararhizobium sp. BT-229 TaxID=2986923 RepID=UPI0021F7AD26|nr:GNAT family N-acetyltransferase [Pararhizobium sp. BT-229]MCV9967694.1 GNAT family N-acetyltransferase [Pararhizobium sp. BT-229]
MHAILGLPQLSTRSDAVTVSVATSLREVEALRSVWSSFAVTDIDSDIDYFMTVVGNDDQIIEPHVLLIRRAADHDLLVVARLQKLTLPLRLGYSVLGEITLRALIISFDGILGSQGRADEDLVFSCLRQSLKKGKADIVLMRNVDVGGDRYAAALASTARLLRGCGQPASHRWVADIPGSFDEFLENRSSKTRKKLRWHDRALRKNFENGLQLRLFKRPEEMEELCRDMQAIASCSYQGGLGVGFSGTSIERALIRLGLAKGWHRTWILYLDGRPVSFWTGLAYGNTFFVGTPGFDPNFAKDSVGRFTMLRMVEDLCADSDISRLDFGQGDAEYKSSFGRDVRLEREILLISARPLTMFLMMTHSLFSVVNNQARKLAVKSKWVRHLKALWRRSKAPTAQSQPVSEL